MKKKYRNKECKNCPQNKREDVVWKKGCQDGIEIGLIMAREKITEGIENYEN